MPSFELPKEEEDDRNEVGDVERDSAERDDGEEGGGTANGNEADYGTDDSNKAEGADRDAQRWVDLLDISYNDSSDRGGGRTTLKKEENGRPLSLANAHTRRVTDAKMLNWHTAAGTIIKQVNTVAPVIDPVAWR
jgi:hypothetical protein